MSACAKFQCLVAGCCPACFVGLIAEAYEAFVDRYSALFRTKTRNVFGTAVKYLEGLVQAEHRTLEQMAEALGEADAQRLQHFISHSPWDHRAIANKIATDANRVLGDQRDSCLILDETSFAKKGDRSVGVARQWSGRLGKVDNCQVAVFAALSNGTQHTLIDMRLYLPEVWLNDPARCNRAGIPEDAREPRSKAAHGLAMVRQARENSVSFQWVGVDAGYGKDPAFLRALDDEGECFVADVHRTQTVWIENPNVHVPIRQSDRGRAPSRPKATTASTTVEAIAATAAPEDWKRLKLREATRGSLTVEVLHRRIWVWDKTEPQARQWHLIVRREVNSKDEIKYSLSNASEETSSQRLAEMQGQRFWIERSFQDGKSFFGLADYQLLGWRAWHHHVTMVMLAMLFVLEQRAEHGPKVDFLTARDIVDLLRATFQPPPDDPAHATVQRINRRHKSRAAAERSRQRRTQPSDETAKVPTSAASGKM